MQAMFAAMANYPLVQKKAQEELDKVLGEGRLPTFEDRPHLPYISAVVNEVLRWHVILPPFVSFLLLMPVVRALRHWGCHTASWRTMNTKVTFFAKGQLSWRTSGRLLP
jgi:hypothetical protein